MPFRVIRSRKGTVVPKLHPDHVRQDLPRPWAIGHGVPGQKESVCFRLSGRPKQPLSMVAETGAGQNGYDARPRGALRIDEVEVAGSRDFQQAACTEHLAHSQWHRVIVNAVNEGDRNGRSGQRRWIGDGIAFRNVVRSATHQQAHRAGAEIPFRTQAQ